MVRVFWIMLVFVFVGSLRGMVGVCCGFLLFVVYNMLEWLVLVNDLVGMVVCCFD